MAMQGKPLTNGKMRKISQTVGQLSAIHRILNLVIGIAMAKI